MRYGSTSFLLSQEGILRIYRPNFAFFGKTISQFIRERRVLRAAELLRSVSTSVCDVATTCGFYDQSHFTHAFRRMMGCTPAQYRSMPRLV